MTLRGSPSTGPTQMPIALHAVGSLLAPADDATLDVPLGVYVLEATINGTPLRGSPYVVRVVPPIVGAAPFSPMRTQIVSNDDSSSSMSVVTYDANGQPLTYGGLAMIATLHERDGAHTLPVTDNGDGTYVVSVTGSQPSADSTLAVTMAGTVRLIVVCVCFVYVYSLASQ